MYLDKIQDIATTLLLACVPTIMILISYFYAYIPIEYIITVTAILWFLSQYTSNQRVKDSVETVKKWIYWDYITNILLGVWPIIVSLQPQLLVYVPLGYVGLVTAVFAVISQYVADLREANSEKDVA